MCNVALLDSVSICIYPREPTFVLVRVRTHIQYACKRLVHNFVCVSVPQYQILLSQLLASLSLVVIRLSTSQPSAPPSVSLSSCPISSESLCSASLCWFYPPPPPHCFLVVYLLRASYCLFTLMPSPSTPNNNSFHPFFFWILSISHSTLVNFISQPLLKMLPWIFLVAFSFSWQNNDMWKQNVTKHNTMFVIF